jgi:ketosteroid isomerase-like protein
MRYVITWFLRLTSATKLSNLAVMNIRSTISALCVAAACLLSQVCAAETLSELLQRQTQEFSDAGQEGNKAVLAKYLDPHVIFVNEDGSVSGKQDVVDGARPATPGITLAIKVTNWSMQQHGDVAVATFVDRLDENFFGQELQYDYRSTEVWKREGKTWRMISSQTLTVQRDPLAMQMTAQMLEAYVGTYQAAPHLKVQITRKYDKLFSSLNEGPATEMKAEAPDVLFTPGQPGRKIFQRDQGGRVTGYRSRRDGRDIVVTKIG